RAPLAQLTCVNHPRARHSNAVAPVRMDWLHRLEPCDRKSHFVAGLAVTIVVEAVVHALCRLVGLGTTDNSRRYTSNTSMRLYIEQDYATSTNLRSLTHPYVSEYLRAGVNKYACPDFRMAIPARFPGAAERYFLKYRYIVADDCSFADHDTSPVINEYA